MLDVDLEEVFVVLVVQCWDNDLLDVLGESLSEVFQEGCGLIQLITDFQYDTA